MSKLYEQYKACKEKNPEKIILIKSGSFYVMLDEDAEIINDLFGLKLTPLNEKIKKCGFPVSSITKYEGIFKESSIDYMITSLENYGTTLSEKEKTVANKIRKLDVNSLTPMEALRILNDFSEILKN